MTVARQYWKLLPSLWLALCPACDGCSKDAPKPPNASPALNSGEFVAPGADGYGKAAGLRFLEVIKGAATPTDTLPLAVFLHGYGEGINDVWLDQVDVPMRVVMFESPRTFKGHFTWMYSPIGPGTSDWLAHTVKVAGEEVAQALRVLTAHRPTQGRVILAGFSQGSVVAFYVTTYHPELVHGAAPIAGLLPKPLWPQSLPGTGPWPPIKAIHGALDTTVLTATARESVDHLAKLGQPATIHVYEGIAHKLTPAMRREMQAAVNGFARELHNQAP